MRLKKFIGKYGNYAFADETNYGNNFGNMVTRTTRLYQMDGAIDEYSGQRAPQELGDISVGWWLFGNTSGSIRQLKDTAFAMAGWGVQRLFIQPEMTWDGVRWANGRISNIRGNENVSNLPHLREKMEANFQINYPAWQGTVTKAWFLNAGLSLDTGMYLDGMWYLDDGLVLDGTYDVMAPRMEVQVVGTAEVSVSNYGNHATRPVITMGGRAAPWVIGGSVIVGGTPPLYLGGYGGATSDLSVKAKRYGKVVDEFRYSGALLANEYVVIDCAKFSVTVDGVSAPRSGYADFDALTGMGFTQLEPGVTTFEISSTSGDGGCYFALDYFDAWY